MQVAYALLAEAISTTPDGRVSMLGADLGVIWTATVPAMHPVIGFAAKVLFEPDEVGSSYQLRVEVADPTGQQIAGASTPDAVVQAPNKLLPGTQSSIALGFNLPALVLPVRGRYTFRVFGQLQNQDAQVLAEVPLYVLPQDLMPQYLSSIPPASGRQEPTPAEARTNEEAQHDPA